MREREGKRRASYVRDKRAGLAESGFLEVSDPGLYPTFTLAPRPASGNLNYTDAEYFIVEVQANAYSTATSYLDTITLRYQGTLPTPTVTPSPTPTPTVTPTATARATATEVLICLLNAQQDGLSAFSQNADLCTCQNSLADFGITLVGAWNAEEQATILTGACKTGQALLLHGVSVSDPAVNDVVEAFRIVMQGQNQGVWRTIEFRWVSTGNPICSTAKNPTADVAAQIDCDVANQLSEYTVVHEFGHVLVGRAAGTGGVTFLTKVESPVVGGGSLRNLAPTPGFIMGSRTYSLSRGISTDWQRSSVITDNGWGSAALWNQQSYYRYNFPEPPPLTPTAFPLLVPQIGPCGEGVPTLPPVNDIPFPFQQNPCTIPDWETLSIEGEITEIEEAAADMFLNWVYWKTVSVPSGFADTLWRSSTCYPNGCADPGQSGEARSVWMDQTMSELFTEFGW
ncbi:MAG: hypothetical protein SF162_10635 [bacterium]|nr:hypothetical protein [bacterium]